MQNKQVRLICITMIECASIIARAIYGVDVKTFTNYDDIKTIENEYGRQERALGREE